MQRLLCVMLSWTCVFMKVYRLLSGWPESRPVVTENAASKWVQRWCALWRWLNEIWGQIRGVLVLFVKKMEQANLLVEKWISVGGKVWENVLLLSRTTTKIALPIVPPFIIDEFLCAELCRHRKLMSLILRQVGNRQVKYERCREVTYVRSRQVVV